MRNPEYLGDGVYVEHVGYGLRLMANSHIAPTDEIFLELAVFDALVRWKKAVEEDQQRGDANVSKTD